MLIAAVIAFCLILLVLAFLAPRLSRYFQEAGDKPLSRRPAGRQQGSGTPWPLVAEAVQQLPQGNQQERFGGAKGTREDTGLTGVSSASMSTREPT